MPLKGAIFSTRQKRIVREAVERFAHPFTTKDVCESLALLKSGVSRATVFRVIQTMITEGRVREIALPDRRRVLVNVTGEGALCLMECADCGRLACCQPSGLARSLESAASKQGLRPMQAAVYVQAKCDQRSCAYRETTSKSPKP